MSNHATRELLRTNKHGPVLQLWLNADTNRRAMTQALRANRTVNTVSIFIEEGYLKATAESIRQLFLSIGSLPLENLYIYSFGENFDVIPVQLLTDLFTWATRLEVFSMYFLELGGNGKHLEPFEKAIREHISLKEFRMENCRFADEMLNDYTLDKFVKALATIPKLEKVDLSATEMGYLWWITPKTLESLGKVPRMTSLSLVNFPIANDHISALHRAINANKKFREISLACDSKYVSKLPALIAKSSYLSHVKVRLESLDDDDFIAKLARGIGMNPWLSRFELRGEASNRMSVEGEAAFVAALEKNPAIEHLDMFFADKKMKQKAKLFLKLNQTKKRNLMRSSTATKQELVNALIYVKEDLDCLFHFLGTKPTLCQT